MREELLLELENEYEQQRIRNEQEEALRKEGITKVFGLVFRDNEAANAFWEKEGYSLRTNLNYRNKSLNENVP